MNRVKTQPLFGRVWLIGLLIFTAIISWMLYDILQREGNLGRGSNVLVMGTNAGFKPFEYKLDGEIVGFDIDIAKEIAKATGKELVIEDMAFDGLLPALNSGQIDMVIAGMSVTPDREKNALFSNSYYLAAQRMIVKRGSSIKNKYQLEGKKIGVQLGTTGDTLASKINGAQVVQFPTAPSVLTELNAGGVDVVILDNAPAEQYITGFNDLMILPGNLSEENYAIAIKLGNDNLLAQVNEVIATMKSDRRYDQLIRKYFGDEAAERETKAKTEQTAEIATKADTMQSKATREQDATAGIEQTNIAEQGAGQ